MKRLWLAAQTRHGHSGEHLTYLFDRFYRVDETP
jgi:hypothetical protein